MKKQKAFPTHSIQEDQEGKFQTSSEGMDLRDYFAAKAMQANLTMFREYPDDFELDKLELESYKAADAMMKVREQ